MNVFDVILQKPLITPLSQRGFKMKILLFPDGAAVRAPNSGAGAAPDGGSKMLRGALEPG